MEEIGLTQLFINLWVFGKPLVLVIIVFLFVRTTLGNYILYLIMALLITYGIWYLSSMYLGPWISESSVNAKNTNQFDTLFYRLAAVQIIDVAAIVLVAYGISKLSWVKK
jgi:hypothetical protein